MRSYDVSSLSLFLRRSVACLFLTGSIVATGPALAESELSYWASKYFSDKIDINETNNRAGSKGKGYFAPEIVDFKARNIRRADADVRLCFDNRSLNGAKRRTLVRETYVGKDWRRYCEYYDVSNGIGYLTHPKRPNPEAITKGMLVSKNELGKITCEAIFSVRSFYSFLSHRSSENNKLSVAEMEIYPYGYEFFPFKDYSGFLKHLHPDDSAWLDPFPEGEITLTALSLKNSWACLSPAFSLYWNTALDRCEAGAMELMSTNDTGEIHVPLLENLEVKMLDMTQACYFPDSKKELKYIRLSK